MSENQQMSFLQHLDELRWRLVRIAIAVISVAVVLWIYQEWVMNHVFLVLKENRNKPTTSTDH
jgi:sec-independent protein translocase protein TatC